MLMIPDEEFEDADYTHPEGWDVCTNVLTFWPGSQRLWHEDTVLCWCQPGVVLDNRYDRGYRIVHQTWNQ